MESNTDYHARIRNELTNTINSYSNSEQWKSALAYWRDKFNSDINVSQVSNVQADKSSDQAMHQESTLKLHNKKISNRSKMVANEKEVNFIERPPHSRSTKPLRRIEINQPLLIYIGSKVEEKDELKYKMVN